MKFRNINLQTGILTLSIGGNDIEFDKLLKRCVFGTNLDRCNQQLSASRDILYSTQMFQDYGRLMDIILAYTGWKQRNAQQDPKRRTLLYVTGYPAFFDDWTEQCDSKSFNPFIGGVKLTKEVRGDFNQMSQELNFVLSYWLDLVNLIVQPNYRPDASQIDFAK